MRTRIYGDHVVHSSPSPPSPSTPLAVTLSGISIEQRLVEVGALRWRLGNLDDDVVRQMTIFKGTNAIITLAATLRGLHFDQLRAIRAPAKYPAC